jgi:uncharacterized protein (TIGR02757 family)
MLKERLDRLYRTFDGGYLRTDPLHFLYRYSDPGDQEVVGLIASCLAYGRVDQIAGILESVLGTMGEHPLAFTSGFEPARQMHLFENLRYRFHDGRDIAALIYGIRQMVEGHGSIEGFFLSSITSPESDIGDGLENFSRNALELDYTPLFPSRGSQSRGLSFFFPLPSRGSACKRLNLFLRWMVRRNDGVDLGLWRSIDPSDLIIPLDTHVSRIAYALGLTSFNKPCWKAAVQVTGSLAEFDPKDPVKYDFALSRLGILDACPSRRDDSKCRPCLLRDLCRFGNLP